MDMQKAGLVICLTVFIVIGINAVLLVSLRRGNEASQIDLMRRAAERARQPWAKEDEALKELSTLVSGLKNFRPVTPEEPENDRRTGPEGQEEQDKSE